MKASRLYLLILSLVLIFAGCSSSDDSSSTDPEKKDCGEEAVRYLAIGSRSDWNSYPKTGSDKAHYTTLYEIEGNQAKFALTLTLYNVCPKEHALVSVQFTTLINDPEVTVTCDAAEYGFPGVKLPIEHKNSVYNGDNFFVFKNTDPPTTFGVVARVLFPTKGSQDADFTYFFDVLMSDYRLDLNYTRSKT